MFSIFDMDGQIKLQKFMYIGEDIYYLPVYLIFFCNVTVHSFISIVKNSIYIQIFLNAHHSMFTIIPKTLDFKM